MWTAISIRNAYIWLAYLRFVEDNDANGVRVDSNLRLWNDTRRRIYASIDRMLEPARDPQVRASQEKVTEMAVTEIARVQNLWRQRGVLRDLGVRPA